VTGKESGHHLDADTLEVVPGAQRQQLEGWVPELANENELREALELRLIGDAERFTDDQLKTVVLIMGYGITLDVERMSFAVLDRDQTTASQNYVLNLEGSSRYFVAGPPILDYEDMDRRMRSGEVSLAIEIPRNFARDIARGRPVEIGAWIDGAVPQRAETIRVYVQDIHLQWLEAGFGRSTAGATPAPFRIETRFRYNPDIESLPAMVPAVISILLIMIPAMLTALSVVREKELGSIVNFYVTPVTRLEFLLGKQLPYVALALLNFAAMVLLSLLVFRVPIKGDFMTLAAGTLVYVGAATAIGLVISTFVSSQVAAIFGAAVLTMIPAVNFSGMVYPVSSLEGAGALLGAVWPTTHYLVIARGTFSKALALPDLQDAFIPLLVAVPALIGAAVALLPKQET